MSCTGIEKSVPELISSLRRDCKNFTETLDQLTWNCRTPTRRVVPRYLLIYLGDLISRSLSVDDFSKIRSCWCDVDDDAKLVFTIALSKLAMACPEKAKELVNGLEVCGGWQFLAKWFYPIIGIWNTSYLDSIEDRRIFLLGWAWYARYVPEDLDIAIDKVLAHSEIVDKPLITALKELRRVDENKVIEKLRDRPVLLRKVIA